jgi:hypothetical protein
MSDKYLEQRINIRFCVKIGKSASETFALLTLAYGEYVMKNWSVTEWHRGSRRGENFAGQPKNWAAKNAKNICKCGHSTNLGAFRSKGRCESNCRKFEYE